MLVNVKINGPKTLSKYPIKYLELVFVSTDFEITILSNYIININIPNSFCFFAP